MARVISVFLPMWPIDRRQRQAGVTSPSGEGPLIIAGRAGNRRVITAACPAARDLGLRAGMTVSRAQALVPDLRIEADDAGADAAALERLALWLLQRVAPIVSTDPPDGIVIDSTGADHLHGGEAAMLEALAGKLALSGITARLALADSWGAAHALARYGADGVIIVPPGASDAALAPLALEALRLPAATVAGLRDLGFETIGDLMDQPRAPLTRRFGAELCLRLDQARGLASEPIAPLRPEGLIEIRRAFAEPIAAPETIARYIGKLVIQLCIELTAKGLGVRRLDLLCARIDNRIEVLRVGLAVPQRDPARLTRLLCDRIVTLDPGLGIEIMTLPGNAGPPTPRDIYIPDLHIDTVRVKSKDFR